MKFYLIRHGQTQWNIEGKIQGKTNISLNETGCRQAEQLSQAMLAHPVAAVFSSPLCRAYDTALAVAEKQKLPVVSLEELKEVDFGLWEGYSWEEINERYPDDFAAWDKNPLLAAPTKGEAREVCSERSKQAVQYIITHSKGDVAVVAHGGILVFIVNYLLRLERDRNGIIMKNASITTVEYDGETGIGTLFALNDDSHLQKMKDGKTNKYC